MINWLAGIIKWLLDTVSQLTGSYGIGIIIATVILRLVLYPLTVSQTKSMAKMKKIQPELNEIQKKYKDKPEEYQKRTMELYQKHKINPLGGCLPLLIQLPILWAFFPVLREIPSGDLSVFLGLWELSQPDPYYIMPLLAAATTYWQSTLTATDSSQKSMMIVMPVMIGLFSLSFPSGLVLYWITSNLLGIAQQAWMNKKFLAEEQGGQAK